ncbi:MAG: 16S rRNA (guanine(527)-N(7))-methyltransferase RsmG, partial [Clostridia bacterium]|nr:16S rRNA (guanine(527)-N(7))-methyltransferase RsmG [Clostridia bacterium]
MKKVFENNKIDIIAQVESDLLLFCDTLLEKNKQFNLTAIREKQEVYEKHFVDSLMGKDFFTAGEKILEVGSGGGFPSVPLKIENRELDFTLLEATGKKCVFLQEIRRLFGFEKFEVVNARAEEYAKTKARESFDIVTARAVAELSILCELCLPFLKVGGKAVFYKQKSEEELSGGKNAVKELGGKIVSVNDYTLFSAPENVRNIIVIEKVK